jgi:hypothetical protein
VIYGHGVTINKETGPLIVGARNAKAGYATIGIDHPSHGSRTDTDRFILDLLSPQRLGRLVNIPMQSALDHVSLMLAIQDHLNTLDVGAWSPFGVRGDGRPDLDVSKILYQGTSLGGVFGHTFVSIAPELKGAFYTVSGTGLVDILAHSVLWLVFRNTIAAGASPGEAQMLVAFASLLTDEADGGNASDRVLANGTPVFLTFGKNDGIVFNGSTDRLVGTLGLPTLTTTMPADGNGVVGFPAFGVDALQQVATHVTFATPASDRWFDAWLANRSAAMGIAE